MSFPFIVYSLRKEWINRPDVVVYRSNKMQNLLFIFQVPSKPETYLLTFEKFEYVQVVIEISA